MTATPPAAGTASPVPPAKKTPPPAKHDWMRFVGWAKDDPTYAEALRIGAEYRQSMTYERETQRVNEDS